MRLVGLLLDSVGYHKARFTPLRLDFSDHEGSPADTVVWLDNGGGKTSLSSLVFSTLRPSMREFIATVRDPSYRLTQYVLAGDTAHVVIEWEVADADGQPRRLITGQAMEWVGGEPSSDAGKLSRVFWTGWRADGVLDLDALPRRGADGDRLPLREFTAALRELAASQPDLEVAVHDDQERWRKELDRRGVDAELLRYQVRMNAEEGGASSVFSFRTPQDFADLLIDFFTRPEEVEPISEHVATLRARAGQRDTHRCELEFADGALSRLEALAAARDDYLRCRTDVEQHAATLSHTLAVAERAAALAAQRAEQAHHDAEQAAATVDELTGHARLFRDGRNEARLIASELRRDNAAGRVLAAEEEQRRAALDAEAADTASALSRRVSVEQQISDIDHQLSAADADAAPLRTRILDLEQALAARLASDRAAAVRDRDAHHRSAEELDAQAGELEQRRHELLREQGELEERASSVRQQRDDAERELQRLRDLELVLPDEALPDAVRRHHRLTEAAQEQAEDARARRDTAADALDDTEAERSSVTEQLAQARSDHAHHLRQLQELELDAATLTGPLVAAAAGLDAGDDTGIAEAVERQPRDLADTLSSQAERRRAEVTELDAHARELTQRQARLRGDDLDATADARDAVSVLASRGVTAVTGWRHLDQSTDPGRRPQVIRSAPAAVDGVVVIDGTDPREAAARLGEWTPRRPLSVSAPSDIDTADGGDDTVVLPPPSRYDRAAATAEAARLDEELETTRRARDEADHDARELSAAAAQLSSFASRWPSGSRDTAEQHVQEAAALLGDLEQRALELSRRATELTRRRDQSADELDRHLDTHRTHLAYAHRLENAAHLAAGAEEHDQRLRAAELRGRQVSRDLGDLDQQVAALRAEAEAHRRRAADADSRAQAAADAARRDGVALPDHPVDATPTEAADSLSSRLRAARDELRNTSACEALQERRNGLERSLAALSEEISSRSSEVVDAARKLLTDGAADESSLRRARDDAQRRHDDALRDKGRAEAAVRAAEDEIHANLPSDRDRHRKDLDRIVGMLDQPTDPPTTVDRAETLAEALEAARERTLAQREEARERVQASTGRRQRLSAQSSELSSVASRIRDLARASEMSLPPAEPSTARVEAAADTADELVAAATTQAEEAAAASSAAREKRAEVASQYQRLRDFVARSEFSEVHSTLKDQLVRGVDDVADDADSLRARLAMRRDQLAKELEEIDRDRGAVVEELTAAVGRTFDLFDRVQRASTMPAEIPEWAGRPFVRMNYTRLDAAQLRQRVGEVVDAAVRGGDPTSGMQLLRSAVHGALGPNGLHANVLKPQTVLSDQRVPVHKMTASDGERLTGAVLLYCVLSRVRQQQRGRGGPQGAGVLWLDNPFGKASRFELVAMQRTMAAAMGVQLVYLSGVKDPDAIAQFPVWQRLRTLQHTPTGSLHVAADGGGESEAALSVSAVRMARRVPAHAAAR